MSRASIEWERDIIDCLSNTTYDDPMPVRDIAEIIGMQESHVSCPRTRKLILKAMKDFNTPIGADGRGFYIIGSAQEMQRYLNQLLQRQIATSERIDIVYNAFHGRYNTN
jgi:hypothetical protein